jgi:DNA-binding NarL/FixJ family response regulator
MPKLRVLLADDHESVREGLKAILNGQSDMEIVGEAGDGHSAVSETQRLLPDVVVMDVSMPLLNGLRATESIAARCASVKIVALTRHADAGYLQQLLRAGASGYVLKQSRTTELLHAIRAVHAGGKYLDPAVAGSVIDAIQRPSGAVTDAPNTQLSGREEEVLRLLAWGYSNKEIAARLDLSVKTIESHKANAMHKLKLVSRTEIVRFALLRGWLQDL